MKKSKVSCGVRNSFQSLKTYDSQMNLKQIQSKIQNVKETEKVSNEQQYLSYSESSDDYEYFVYKVKKGASRKGHEEAKRQSMKLMQNPIHKSNKK